MLLVLGVVNAATTPFFPWVVFPAVGMAVSLANRLGGLWADGVRIGDIVGNRSRRPRGAVPRLALPAGRLPLAAEQAERSRIEIAELAADLPATDRALIPDVMPTVDRLVDRVRLLSTTLTRLDAAVSPGAMANLDRRIADAEATNAAERTLVLLRRQRESLHDLLERRTTLRAQIESASLALENLRLQMVKLRSAGVQVSIDNVASATQEARGLAREIDHVLDAAAELRALDRRADDE
jgi:hypothetical protein